MKTHPIPIAPVPRAVIANKSSSIRNAFCGRLGELESFISPFVGWMSSNLSIDSLMGGSSIENILFHFHLKSFGTCNCMKFTASSHRSSAAQSINKLAVRMPDNAMELSFALPIDAKCIQMTKRNLDQRNQNPREFKKIYQRCKWCWCTRIAARCRSIHLFMG